MQLLEDRVAIVTGGCGALGRAVVELFLTEGARVAVPYPEQGEAQRLLQRLGDRFPDSAFKLIAADLTDFDQVRQMVDEVVTAWGKIDALANLVGGFWGGNPIAETSLAQWEAMFDLNLTTTFLCCKAVVPVMQQHGHGRIVSVTSRSGLQGAGDFAAYAVAKGAIATFTASLAEETIDHGILVNAIAPSTIDTEANRSAMPKARHDRWVKPEEIAPTVAFLCSPQCQATSGAVIPVFGRA